MPEFAPYIQRITVTFDYPVHFVHGVFAPDRNLLADVLDRRHELRRHRCLAVVDQGVAAAHGTIVSDIGQYFRARKDRLELACPPLVMPGGESAKTSWNAVGDLISTLGRLHMDRQGFVIAVGGGSLLDMVGFAAAIVHRGLRLVRVPSTTLAQADAGIGVKNGLDEHGMKNFVGAFAPPFAVINDFDLVRTLSDEHWIGGLAEAFKVATIADAGLFHMLCRSARALRDRDQKTMEQAVYRCAVLHLEHIRTAGDPFEMGSARPMDFGHWAAHKLESMTEFRLPHGQAVAVGLAVDACYACHRGLLGGEDFHALLAALMDCGLPIWHEALDRRDDDGRLAVLQGLNDFREHLGGALTVTLPDGLGARTEVHEMNAELIEQCIAELQRRQQEPTPA